MKISVVLLFVFLYIAQGVPSREGIHDSHTYSTKNDLTEDRFIQQMSDESFGAYGEFGSDPNVEVVGYDHEHPYEDFSADVGRYPDYEQFHSFEGYEDVIPREIRVSGLSIEDMDKTTYEEGKDSDTNEDEQSTSRNLRNTEKDSDDLSTSAGLGEELDEPAEEIEDVTVKGLSDYSYLVGDKLHGINEMRASGAMKGPHTVTFDDEDSEEFEDLDYVVETDENLNYEEFLEDENREVQNYQYDHEYDHEDEVIVRGQAIENEDDEEFEDEDFEEEDFEGDYEIDDSERLEDDDYDGDDDYYDEDEDEDEVDEIDAGVRSLDADLDDEYDDDEDDFEEEDDEDEYFASRYEGESGTERNVKGMSVSFVEDEEDDEDYEDDEYEDDEYEDDLPESGRQDGDYEDDEVDDEYDGEYVRQWDDEEEDDEDWEEEDEELDEEVPEFDENEAFESLHGDDIKSDVRTGERK